MRTVANVHVHLCTCRTGPSGRAVVHDVETVVIEWTHQIRAVLKKDSAQPLLEGLNPTPYVEIEFWNAKTQNLSCIFEQVTLPIAVYVRCTVVQRWRDIVKLKQSSHV